MATRTFSSFKDLSTGALSFTTNMTTTEAAYLSYIAVNFSAAPASAETITVSITSRNGANYDMFLLSKATTAATTTHMAFVFGSTIPITTTDQVKVTCTNVSVDKIAYVNVVLDTVARSGPGIFMYNNGVLVGTSGGLT